MPDVFVENDLDAASFALAEWIFAIAEDALQARSLFSIALSGGSTPRSLHAWLSAPQNLGRIDWRRSQVFWSDERLVPLDDEQSNFRMAQETLLVPAGIPAVNVHAAPVEETPPSRAASLYERELIKVLGGQPRFDLILLGMGPDGHTASLFPGAEELEAEDSVVAATRLPHNGLHRLTFTLPLINDARHIAFLIAGVDKRLAIERVLKGDQSLPAAKVRPLGGELRWYFDRAAFPNGGTSTR